MIHIEVHSPDGLDPTHAQWIERALAHTLRAESIERAEVTLALLPDEEIRALNERFLRHDWPTDVLTFPLDVDDGIAGDIYIGIGPAGENAREFGCPLREEFVRLAVHGALHLLGRDHPEGEEREKSPFWARQEALVREVLEDEPGV